MAKNSNWVPVKPEKQPARKDDRSVVVPGKVIDDGDRPHRQQAPLPDPQPVKKK